MYVFMLIKIESSAICKLPKICQSVKLWSSNDIGMRNYNRVYCTSAIAGMYLISISSKKLIRQMSIKNHKKLTSSKTAPLLEQSCIQKI